MTRPQIITATFAQNVAFTTMPGKMRAALVTAANRRGIPETIPARFRVEYTKVQDFGDAKAPHYTAVLAGEIMAVHTELVHRGCAGTTLVRAECLGRAA